MQEEDKTKEQLINELVELRRRVAQLEKSETKHKRDAALLWDSEERYKALFHRTLYCVYVHDLKGRFIDANDTALNLLGYTREEIRSLDFSSLIEGEDVPKAFRSLEELMKTDSDTVRCKDGSEKVVHFRSVTMATVDQLIIYEDITEKKRLEGQLLQAQKMEAIGTLAAGVAHDFNNLLMNIQANASLMLLGIDPTHPHYERLKSIEHSVQSGTDLTRQFLGFAKRGKYEVRPTDLNELIEKSAEMFGRTKKELRIHRKYQKDVWAVEVDQGQIEQVLLNLYVNAWQATPGGGELYLQTENITLDKNYMKPYRVKPGRYIKISVTGTGVGMDEAT